MVVQGIKQGYKEAGTRERIVYRVVGTSLVCYGLYKGINSTFPTNHTFSATLETQKFTAQVYHGPTNFSLDSAQDMRQKNLAKFSSFKK